MPTVDFDKININNNDNNNNYAPADLEELKKQFPLKDVVLKLGYDIKGDKILCPFHNDLSPSCHIYTDRFHCYSCGANGDLFDFWGKCNNMEGSENLPRQIEEIHALFGIGYKPQFFSSSVNTISDHFKITHQERKSTQELLLKICQYYHECLLQNEELLNYVISRFQPSLGYDKSLQLIKDNLIGFSKDNVGIVARDKIGCNVEDVLTTGFAIKTAKGDIEDVMQKRIIFPVWQKGKIVYASCRATRFCDEKDMLKKYKKLVAKSESHPYSMVTNTLFHAENDKLPRNNHYIVISEETIGGYIGKALGINLVSLMTKQASKNDIENLKRICANVSSIYIINDNENSEAGLNGAIITATELLPLKKDIRIILLPKKKCNKVGLSEYFGLGNGREELLELCENSMDFIELMINRTEESKKPQTALIKLEPVLKLLAEHKDHLTYYDSYIEKIAEKSHCKKTEVSKMISIYSDKYPESKKQNNKNKGELLTAYDAGSENFSVEGYALFQRQNGKDTTPKQIATFTGILDREITYDDGINSTGNKRSYEGTFMCAPNGETQHFSINAEDFADPKLFRKCVANTLGPKGNFSPGYEGLLINYINAQSNNAGKPKKEIVYSHTGWSNDRKTFYYPKFSINKDMSLTEDSVRVELVKKDLNNPTESNIGNYNKFEFIREESKDKILNYLKEGVFDGLLKIFNYSITLPCVATVFLPILFPFMKEEGKKYLLWIYGPTGTGKTMMSSMLASFYGDFTNEVPPIGWGSTPWAVERWGYCLPDILANVDDYKYANVGEGNRKQMLIQVIQNYSDQTSRMRLNQSSEMKSSYPIRSFLVSSGEDLPSGEPSTVARLLPVEINMRGNTKIFHKTKEMKKYFRAITPSFIHWFMNQHDLNGLNYSNDIRKKQEEYQNRIEIVLGNPDKKGNNNEKRDSTQNVNRMASNLAMNVLGLDTFLQYAEYMGIDKVECDKLRMVYNDNLNEFIKKYANAIVEESQTTAVIDIVMEILGSNDVYIEHLYDDYFGDNDRKPAYSAKKIGFAQGDYVYIFPNVLISEVQKIRKNLSVSRSDLFRQLNIKGLTEAGENKDSTVMIMIKQNDNDSRGVPTRVLKFYRQVFMPAWKNAVTKPDIGGIESELKKGNMRYNEDDENIFTPF